MWPWLVLILALASGCGSHSASLDQSRSSSPTPAPARTYDREALSVVRKWATAEFVTFNCGVAQSLTALGATQQELACSDNQAEMLKASEQGPAFHVGGEAILQAL
jgi:hypothetical protein